MDFCEEAGWLSSGFSDVTRGEVVDTIRYRRHGVVEAVLDGAKDVLLF